MALTAKKPVEHKTLHAKTLDKVRDLAAVAEVGKEAMARVNFNLPESQRRRWRMAAAARDVSLTDLIVQAVERDLVRDE